jgi:hypothetical protein
MPQTRHLVILVTCISGSAEVAIGALATMGSEPTLRMEFNLTVCYRRVGVFGRPIGDAEASRGRSSCPVTQVNC